MTSPIPPTTGQPVNFHTNVNRAKTRRWVEAKSYAYDGDDWGDGDEYEDEYDEPAPPGQSQHALPPGHPQNPQTAQTAPGQRYGDLSHRQVGQPANRSTTNPAMMHNRGQPSFDQGDERRAFSTNIGGFDGPYPTAQCAPFSQSDQFPQVGNNDPRMGPQRGPPPFSGNQQGHRPSMEQDSYSHAPLMPDSRPGPYSDPRNGRYAGQIPQQGRRSQSSGRPSHADIYGGRESPSRAIPSPLSAVSHGSRDGSPGKSFPPRKSSLSQQTGPPEFIQPQMSQEHGETGGQVLDSPVETKPLPFIRPADIYKRMAEEREKERRASEESSRPSLEDLESQKRLKPALDPVAERKSEYGLENLTKPAELPQNLPPASNDAEATKAEAAQDDGASGYAPEQSISTGKAPDHEEPPSSTSETKQAQAKASTNDEQSAGADDVAENTTQELRSDSALQHRPSAGFTSVVHQAFDDSQNKVPPTPSSVSGNSLIRSNSASASDISPIIERAPSNSKERPMSSSTITPTTAQSFPEQEDDPLPPPIRPGFRRDSRTPSPGNSPARRPISVATADVPREELAVLSANTPTQNKPVNDVPSPVPRAESPMKGTVRDLAGKIENRSPATSPVRSPASMAETPRPASQRLESFRPSLPGGWTSYTTIGTPSPTQGSTPFQSTDNLQREPAAISAPQEDDMPVAGPPKPVEEGYDVSGTAFQALVGAASALSDAFGSVTGTNQGDWPDNETPTEGSTTDATPASERPGGLSPVQEVPSVASDTPPTPPAKDAPYERKTSQLGYFPSPLRTSKSAETPTPMRPEMLPALSTDNSPQDTESDRLRKEIVRSLTPKSPKGQSDLRTEVDPEPTLKPVQVDTSIAATSSSPDSVQASVDKPHGEDGKHFDDVADEGANEGTNSMDESRLDEKARDQGTEDIYDLEAVLPEKESYALGDEDEAREPSIQPSEAPPARPLQQKFSWEASTEDVETLPEPTETVAATFAPIQGSDNIVSPETTEAPTNSITADIPLRSKPSDDDITGGVKDRPTIIPVADSNENLRSDLPPPPVAKGLSEPRRSTDMEPAHEPVSTQQSLSGGPAQISTSGLPSEQAQEYAAQPFLPTPIGKEISFREILGMNTAQERIRAYNSSRQQLAAQDSGLTNWLQATGSQYSEHQQLLNQNGRPLGPQADGVHAHKPSPSRSKFSSFGASLGGAANAQSNDGSKTSFGSPSSSKLTSQQVQEEGKKLLQSAGKLGGKAGGAAKGLFAKGKNKFRASSGGGDKALPSSRHTSQPVINVEDVQHSPATATTAPQISPIFTGVNSNDTWSLSYAPSDNVSRTTTVDKTPPDGRSTTEQPKYANLGPPDYTDELVDSKNTLKVPPTPSPQVSPLGSTYLDDIPSRSISEVTSPDVRAQNVSPAQPDAQDRALGGEHAEEQIVGPLSSTVNSPQRSRPPSSYTPDDTTPPVDRNESLTLLKRTLDEPPDVDSPGSIYSRRTDDMLLQHKPNGNQNSTENNTPIEDSEPRSQPRSAGLKPQRSMVSAVSSPSPGPAVADHDGLARTITRHSVSPAQQDTEGEKQSPAVSPPTQSPPYEDATPPYSAAVDSKEAEAAAEKPLEASYGRPQSLPAYQSPIQENASNLPFQPSAVVPVADLSSRRREEVRRPSSRPFSFTNSTNEDILHRHTHSKESQHSSTAASSWSKELGLEINEADLGQHPALRGMVDKPLPSQNRNYISPHRATQQKPASNVSMQQEQQYRIPGPYGQQFRSPKPISTSLDVEKIQLQRPPNSAPLVEREKTGSDPAMTHHRHRSSEANVIPRLSTTEYTSPSVITPQESSKSNTKARSAAARLFRPRSRSRSRLSNDDDTDQNQNHQQEHRKREGRGGIFWSHNKQDNESTSGGPDSKRANSGGSHRGLNFQQQPASFQDSDAAPNEKKTKFIGQKFTKKLHHIATSSNQTETENKKKGGFLRLSGLFAKSGKQSPPPLVQRHPVQRAVTVQPIFDPPHPTASERAFSVPHQEQQIGRRSQDPLDYNNQRTDAFQGQAPPFGGYYAPVNRAPDSVEHQPRPMRDPEAFIGGRRLSDQRLADQARALKNVSSQAENQFLLPPSQHSPKVLPHSAPPSSQHFDPSQIQQPRATSQRFPPDLNLRIDTSGQFGPNRRSQPVPLVGTNTPNQDSSRVRVSAPDQSTTANKNNILTHTTSNPQRTSPYTVNTTRTSPHSPHGYGTARGLRQDNLSHAIDLHKRSRSPRNGRRDSIDSPEEIINVQDPANKLGTFASKKPQRGGDGGDGEDDGQEKPWKIDLPLDDDEKPKTAAEKLMAGAGGQRVPLSSGSAARNSKNVKVAELPGSKAPADESSDDEIVMSSTAYPGQEWMPEMYGYGYGDE